MGEQPGALLLTWFYLNQHDKWSHAQESVGCNYLSILKLQLLHHWSLGMDKQFNLTLYNVCNYLSMLGLKLNHVSKGAPNVSFEELKHNQSKTRQNHGHKFMGDIV